MKQPERESKAKELESENQLLRFSKILVLFIAFWNVINRNSSLLFPNTSYTCVCLQKKIEKELTQTSKRAIKKKEISIHH